MGYWTNSCTIKLSMATSQDRGTSLDQGNQAFGEKKYQLLRNIYVVLFGFPEDLYVAAEGTGW